MTVNETDQIITIMGVAGSGKSTIASLLSQTYSWPMIEGDDLHPQKNVEKMARGQPLTNEDRMPWLDAIASAANNHPSGPIILACSALNDAVRSRLIDGINRPCRWIILDVPAPILAERLEQRKGHFMNPSLLTSQLAALEIPANVIRITATSSPQKICNAIMRALRDMP